MVYGKDLNGITASFSDPRLQIRAVHSLPNPTYAFIDIEVPASLPPGTYTLTLTKGNATTTVDYPILQRESTAGRHQGFGTEDAVYLLTPDRFADGNPANNRVEGILDEFDRTKDNMRHGGDLQGIIDRLDYLQDLGITAIWPMPILENNIQRSYHGYQATDLYRIDPRYGTNADFKQLVEEAHAHGIKFIFDHVANHIGVTHPWIDNLPTPTWVNGSKTDHLRQKHYKMSITDPYADPNAETLLKSFWFVDNMPDLNQRDPYLATYLIQNSLWWIEYTGMDGIREDTYPYPDQQFLADWAKAILAEYPDFNIVGEIWEDKPAYLAMFQKESKLPRNFETNLPCVMDFALSEAWRAYLAGTGNLYGVYRILAQDFVYTDPNNLLTFFDNHDMTRGIYVANGETRKVKQVMAMLLTTRGIPQLMYGTEINMMGGASHVELRADFPGGFPGDERDAFTEAGRTNEENEVFNYLRTLLQLRKAHKALTRGSLMHYQPTPWREDIYTYVRTHGDEQILVVVNGKDQKQQADLSDLAHWLPATATLTNLITNQSHVLSADYKLDIEPWDALVLLIDGW